MDHNNYHQQSRNYNRPRLIKTPVPNELWQSTTHATYTPPRIDLLKREGRRKLLLKRFLFREIAEATTQEMSKPYPVEEYNTEYDGSFRVRDFVPSMDNTSQDSELHKKYPLYSGASVSICQDNIRCMVGVTPSVDPLAPFKKNSAFTKPLHEILDEATYRHKCLTACEKIGGSKFVS